jgi:hypothetical protein
MRCLLFISLVFGSLMNGFAQSPPGGPLNGEFDKNCVYRNKYTESERLKFYPFNIADTIKLISFRYHSNNYPIGNGHINTDSLLEQKILNKEEVAGLTDFLYNIMPKRPGNIGTFSMCFWPRNAILFIDKSGKLKEYVLICFHCHRYESSSSGNFGNWDECYQKSEILRKFFVSAGIKFGTDLSIREYPGECDGCQ